MKWFFYLMKIITYLPLRLLYPVKIIGRKNMPKGKVVAVGNHLSAADIVMQLSNLPGFRYIVAKKELSKNKFVGAFLAALGAIYIDRGKADLSAMKKILGVMQKGYGLSIFPEGTRNRKGTMLGQIKEGAALFAIKGKADVVPVMIYKKAKLFRRNYLWVGKSFSLGEFYGKRADAALLKEASDIIEEHMLKAQKDLNDYVFYNKSKFGKRLKKDAVKAEKSLKKLLGEKQ